MMEKLQTEDFPCAGVVVIYRVCKLVRLLKSFVITNYNGSIFPIINPNPTSGH
jgi:hypothetical protein